MYLDIFFIRSITWLYNAGQFSRLRILKKRLYRIGQILRASTVNALSKYGVFYSQSDSAIDHLVDLLRTMEQAVFVSTEDTYGYEFGPNLAA